MDFQATLELLLGLGGKAAGRPSVARNEYHETTRHHLIGSCVRIFTNKSAQKDSKPQVRGKRKKTHVVFEKVPLFTGCKDINRKTESTLRGPPKEGPAHLDVSLNLVGLKRKNANV